MTISPRLGGTVPARAVRWNGQAMLFRIVPAGRNHSPPVARSDRFDHGGGVVAGVCRVGWRGSRCVDVASVRPCSEIGGCKDGDISASRRNWTCPRGALERPSNALSNGPCGKAQLPCSRALRPFLSDMGAESGPARVQTGEPLRDGRVSAAVEREWRGRECRYLRD